MQLEVFTGILACLLPFKYVFINDRTMMLPPLPRLLCRAGVCGCRLLMPSISTYLNLGGVSAAAGEL